MLDRLRRVLRLYEPLLVAVAAILVLVHLVPPLR